MGNLGALEQGVDGYVNQPCARRGERHQACGAGFAEPTCHSITGFQPPPPQGGRCDADGPFQFREGKAAFATGQSRCIGRSTQRQSVKRLRSFVQGLHHRTSPCHITGDRESILAETVAIDVTSFTDLDAVAADADGALDRDQQKNLFDRIDWYRLLLQHCDLGGSPFIVRARDPDGAAWLFLIRSGRHAKALANWYSLEAGPVSHGIVKPALFEALARRLRAVNIGSVALYPVTADRLALLSAPFRAAGWIVHSPARTANWSIDLPKTGWDAYLSARPSRLRSTLSRKQRSSAPEIQIISDFQDNSWDIYEEIYAESWKPREGSPSFLRALARSEGEAGTLRLGIAHDGDKAVAAQFWLVENGAATIHKLAHVEDKRSQSSGTLLTAAMFRHAIEQDQVTRVNFGTGDEQYKADWMDRRQPLFEVKLFNPWTFRGLSGYMRERLSDVRSTIRRVT